MTPPNTVKINPTATTMNHQPLPLPSTTTNTIDHNRPLPPPTTATTVHNCQHLQLQEKRTNNTIKIGSWIASLIRPYWLEIGDEHGSKFVVAKNSASPRCDVASASPLYIGVGTDDLPS
ncbi:Hypothetical predicted protein, partial [Olea europaea subsp. europaea]